MATTILIPTALRAFTDTNAQVEVEGRTVGEVLRRWSRATRRFAPHLFAEDGRLRNFVNVYVNDEDCRHLQSTATELRAGDVVSIVPAIAGGR